MHNPAFLAGLCSLALSTPLLGQEARKEWMYVQDNFQISTLDPASGAVLSQFSLFPLVLNQGLIYDDGHLYFVNTNILLVRDFLVELNPASGDWREVGKTGVGSQGFLHLTRSSTGPGFLALYNQAFFAVSKSTGEMKFSSRVESGVGVLTAFAANSAGELYAFSPATIYYPRPALYRVEIASGQLTHFGDLPPNSVEFRALAFDGNDTLWGAGVGPYTQFKFRLFKIDLQTLELVASFPLPNGAQGIAFGPAPDVEGYCAAKLNSAGCAPSIDWSGHPSATAHLGFEVSCSEVHNQSAGLLLLGLGGPAATPFQGGTLCVAAPILRTTPMDSGGSPAAQSDCTGSWSIDLNAWLLKHHPLDAGASFACQWWGRDPGLSGPEASQLSDALEVLLFP